MQSFEFTKGDNVVTINDYVDEQPGLYTFSLDNLNQVLIVKAEDGGIKCEIHIAVDEVVVNGDTFSGTAAQLKTLLLADVFNDSSDAGGTVSIPETAYADNATALAALGAGKMYKSTTLINGSPIILITLTV